MDKIITDAGGVFGDVAKDFECVAVKPVQPVFCAKPEKAFIILYAAKDGIVGEPVLHLVMTK